MPKYRPLKKSNSTNNLQSSISNNREEKEQLLKELQIHQIELEQQNKELQENQYQLEESRNRYAELYDFAPVGYANLDPYGLILDINQTGARLLGTERPQLLGKPFALFVEKSYLHQFRNHLRQCKLTDEKVITEVKLLAGAQKEPIWIELSSLVIRDSVKKNTILRTVFADITKRKLVEEALDKAYCELEMRVLERTADLNNQILERQRAEAALDIEKEFLNRTLYSVGDGVITTDTQGKIVIFNRTAEHLTGWSQAEASGQLLSKIFYVINNKTSEVYDDIVKNTLENNEIYLSNDKVLVTKDLFEIPVEVHSSPIKTIHGENDGVVIVFRDVTEKHKIEAELIKAEKLESLGVLAGGIAHDFNNILAAILANLQLAMVKLDKGLNIQKYLQSAIETTKKASNLTGQLLTFAKGGAPVKKAASVKEILEDTAAFALHGSKVKCQIDIPDNLWTVEVDEGQISQVIHNLVINAQHAMPKGGTIEISAQNITIEPEGRFVPGDYIKIKLKDNGVGIPEQYSTKIFDPFFTTRKEGTGLGLATSYSIIKKHDGYIEFESKEGVGTTFYIYLPAAPDWNRILEKNEPAAVMDIRGSGRILLMDDEETILKTVGEMLRCVGYEVTLARDGSETIELYRQAKDRGEPFKAIIMDLTVPGGMGGQETIAYLLDIDRKVKAIVSSGYANDPIMAEYERYGFSGVVAKPYKFDELVDVLNKVISQGKQSFQ
jgi:PAS domain S-box-containing protein